MPIPSNFRQNVKPNWCPGCGDFAVLKALPDALGELGLKPHDVVTVSGIGCSGRISGYLHSYGFHSIHGRALPLAQGIKLANTDLTVVAAGGDGDGLAIGLNHLIHAIRRNIDLTYVIIDNHIYGLTKGQTSPTSPTGFVTKTSPRGSVDATIPPLRLALTAGIGFLAQGFTGNIEQLTRLIKAGVSHKGFSLIVVLSQCKTYNKQNTIKWYRDNIYDIDQDNSYSPHDRTAAWTLLQQHGELVTGLVYQEDKPSYHDLLQPSCETPLVQLDLAPSQDLLDKLMQAFS